MKEVGGDRGWVPVSYFIITFALPPESPSSQSWFIGKRTNVQPEVLASEDAQHSSESVMTHSTVTVDGLDRLIVDTNSPTWKVLPAALQKYRITHDKWQDYAIFICYGPSGNRTERCLSYDEMPLLLFQKLKNAKRDPVFMLKHTKEISSPMTVAKRKLAAKQASRSTALTSALVGCARNEKTFKFADTAVSSRLGPALDAVPERTAVLQLPTEISPEADHRQAGIGSISRAIFALAIYPYMAEKEDEFDVCL